MVLVPPTKPNQVPDLRQRDVRETIVKEVTTTNYISISGCAFDAEHPDTGDLSKDFDSGKITITSKVTLGDEAIVVGVNIPNGAIITTCVAYGSSALCKWRLSRITLSSGTNVLLSNDGVAVNTADNTIENATIDNKIYAYYLSVVVDADADEIYGARITYTTTT